MRRLGACVVLTAGIACGTPKPERPPQETTTTKDLGAVIARVGDEAIYAEEVRALARRRHVDAKTALDEAIRFRLVAAAAREAGFTSPPPRADGNALGRARDRLLVQRLLERDFEPATEREDVPDKDLRAIYERLSKRWVHGRLVDIAILSVYDDAHMKPAARETARKSAADLKAHLAKARPKTGEELLAIGHDPAWRKRRVVAARLLQSADEPFSPAVGQAVQQLKRVGDITAFVDDDRGHHVAMYMGEQPAKNVPFEAARAEILDQIYPEWRKSRFAEFTKALLDEHRAVIDQAALRTAAAGGT